jgi:NADPH-dependent curcumin reductase CurA
MSLSSRRIVLAKRPATTVDPPCFRLESVPLEAPREGELLLRTLWLSLDPYMRGRMSAAPSYADPVAVGGVMPGQTVSEVQISRHPGYREGDLVLASSGWQELAVASADGLIRLSVDPPSYALGVLGMPGFTAYVGLLDIGKPRAGETVAVAAATGAVGSVVGQIAKIKGCHVVGIAGGLEKCDSAVRDLKFDACIDHRSPAFERELAGACPDGIDVYYENVGGRVLRAVMPLLNAHARIPLCGLISQYDEASPGATHDALPAFLRSILVKRITLGGFIISDGFEHRRAEFLVAMTEWLREGKMRYREDVVSGLENAPAAFMGLLAGRNFGKLVVKVAARRGSGA